MPLCHFAFGGLHREGKLQDQLDSFLNHILYPKKLQAFECPEFMPLINSPNTLFADPNSAVISDGGLVLQNWVPSPPVSLMPSEVFMISFVDVPLKKLRHWSPSSHYGRLGLAFTDGFRSRQKVKSVAYYPDFIGLAKDPKVISLNKAIAEQDAELIECLRSEVVERRKPAKLWPELNNLFAVLQLKTDGGGNVSMEKLTYSRYPEGYDFTLEREARIVTSKDSTVIGFNESDVLAVIVPDDRARDLVRDCLKLEWANVPEVVIYPS
jgi:hypothetical protein